MRALIAVVGVLLAIALNGCGSSASGDQQLNQVQACRQWLHLKTHPGSDPLSATSDLLGKVKPGTPIAEALLQLTQDMNHNMTHSQTKPLGGDLLKLDRICA